MPSIEKFCSAMRWAADSDRVGYSQSDRYSLTASDFFGGGSYNTDCSALVVAALKHAGFDTGGATYTGNMSANLCARGWKRLPVDGKPRKGDILLNDAHHVAVWLGDCLAQASIGEGGLVSGGARGDQTRGEVNTRNYYNYPWNCYLRYEGEIDMPINWPTRTWPINMSDAQKWHPVWNKDGSFVLESVSCKKRLDVVDGKDAAGTVVRVHQANGADAQRWTLVRSAKTPGGDPYTPADIAPWKLKPACAPKMRLVDKAGKTVLQKASSSNAQNWQVLDCGDGNWVIVNVKSGKALDVVDGGR